MSIRGLSYDLASQKFSFNDGPYRLTRGEFLDELRKRHPTWGEQRLNQTASALVTRAKRQATTE